VEERLAQEEREHILHWMQAHTPEEQNREAVVCLRKETHAAVARRQRPAGWQSAALVL